MNLPNQGPKVIKRGNVFKIREVFIQSTTARYKGLRDKMKAALPPEWSVEIVCFTLGIRGSYAE